MSVEDNDVVIHSPDPAYVSIVGGLFRTVLAALSGAGVVWASKWSDEQVITAAMATVFIGTAVWSAYEKVRSIQKRKAAAVTSAIRSAEATAVIGQPTAIAVVDPGKAI